MKRKSVLRLRTVFLLLLIFAVVSTGLALKVKRTYTQTISPDNMDFSCSAGTYKHDARASTFGSIYTVVINRSNSEEESSITVTNGQCMTNTMALTAGSYTVISDVAVDSGIGEIQVRSPEIVSSCVQGNGN